MQLYGSLYFIIGEYDNSLQYENKSLQIYPNNFGDKPPIMTNSNNSIGCSLRDKGEYDKAIFLS